MRITEIAAFRVDLPLHEGRYAWSGGKSVDVFDSTIVRITTDEGLVGYGEVCPLGPVYLPSYAAGARAGIAELAPSLIGLDPRELDVLNRTMDKNLKGHPYAKSAIDVACWDILGQFAGMPICTLLGGRYGEDFVLYRAISQEAPEAMAAKVKGYRDEGYRRFQLKVGGDPDVDIERIRQVAAELETGDKLIADANTGWLAHEAARVVRAVEDIDVYIEQPCETYEECLSIRRRTSHPFVLDENIDGLAILLRAHAERAHGRAQCRRTCATRCQAVGLELAGEAHGLDVGAPAPRGAQILECLLGAACRENAAGHHGQLHARGAIDQRHDARRALAHGHLEHGLRQEPEEKQECHHPQAAQNSAYERRKRRYRKAIGPQADAGEHQAHEQEPDPRSVRGEMDGEIGHGMGRLAAGASSATGRQDTG